MKIEYRDIAIADFDYPLPNEQIAVYPLKERDRSKLLTYKDGQVYDDEFFNLANHLPPGSLLVINDTRVIEARLLFQKPTGGVIEIFCLEPYGQTVEDSLSSSTKVQWQCLIGGASKWKAGQLLQKEIAIGPDRGLLTASYISRQTDSFIIEFSWEPALFSFAEILHAAGAIPLPPYIKREATEEDKERYQTVFGVNEGSVAAPTAALHFSQQVFDQLSEKKIDVARLTLHVGAGTFKPVKTATIGAHTMHKEPFTVSIQTLEKLLTSDSIIAVGTTSLRTLESIYWMGVKLLHGLIENEWTLEQWEAYELERDHPQVDAAESIHCIISWMKRNDLSEIHCQTSLMIVPGYQFKIPRALVTNFHQPQSTLLLLVCAFIGPKWKEVYQHALNNGYRFLSFGDSSLLWRTG